MTSPPKKITLLRPAPLTPLTPSRELHRRTRTLALTVSGLTLAGMWAAYSWTQAHRAGLQFQTADVAEALASTAVIFAAGAALGGAARPLRLRFPRLAAYVTLAPPGLALGAKAVEETTDTQIGGSAPVVDVLGVAARTPTRGSGSGTMAGLARGHRHRCPSGGRRRHG